MDKYIKRTIKNKLNSIFFVHINRVVKNYFMIINFHQLSEKYDPRLHWDGTWTNINNFENLLLELKNHYKIIPLSEGIYMTKKSEIKDKLLSITFDDGDQSLKSVLPILSRHNIPATFFINTAYLSNKNYSYQVLKYLVHKKEIYGDKPQLLLNKFKSFRNTRDKLFYDQFRNEFLELCKFIHEKINLIVDETFLSTIDASLFELGLHGHEHERYSMMSEDWQENDLKKNIELLSSYKSFRPIFAIPYGKPWDWDNRTIKIALNNGLDILFHDSGINVKNEVGFKRIPADGKNYKQLFYDLPF